jgi:hypothetical protein
MYRRFDFGFQWLLDRIARSPAAWALYAFLIFVPVEEKVRPSYLQVVRSAARRATSEYSD